MLIADGRRSEVRLIAQGDLYLELQDAFKMCLQFGSYTVVFTPNWTWIDCHPFNPAGYHSDGLYIYASLIITLNWFSPCTRERLLQSDPLKGRIYWLLYMSSATGSTPRTWRGYFSWFLPMLPGKVTLVGSYRYCHRKWGSGRSIDINASGLPALKWRCSN